VMWSRRGNGPEWAAAASTRSVLLRVIGAWGPLGPLRGGLGIERAVLACAVCGAMWGVHVGCGWGGRPREFC
jgi:hypothetical protein